MDRFLFAILAAAGTAFAALAPAVANSVDPGLEKSDGVAEVRGDWQTAISPQGCRVEISWKYDYSGKPYLKKIRICA